MSSFCLVWKSASSSDGNDSLPLDFILLGISTKSAEQVSGSDARVIFFCLLFLR